MLFGKFGGIADADDAARWVASDNERGESDRRGYRFERPRRHIDDQSRDLAAANPLELISNRLNVPRPLIVLAGTEGREHLVDEGAEVVAQQALSLRASVAIAFLLTIDLFAEFSGGRFGLKQILR